MNIRKIVIFVVSITIIESNSLYYYSRFVDKHVEYTLSESFLAKLFYIVGEYEADYIKL